jgi:hypothetical protein
MISALGVGAGWRAVINGSVILVALLTLQKDIRVWGARARRAFGSTRRSGAIEPSTPTGRNPS